ncbi:MAG: S-formylglutathione hydrolase [Alphaproteobacteria bacterium]
MSVELLSENKAFGGWHKRYKHSSSALSCDMTFAIYLPPQATEVQKVPCMYWLSGLTCTDENFMQKAGAFRIAAELGIAIIAPDTSPRGDNVPDDPDEGYDLGLGAGFYLNATQSPWDTHYHMYDYITDELPALIETNFPINQKRGISGHSMGGHGALVLSLRNPDLYISASAFSPISNPVNCPWGEKAFSNYLGDDQKQWGQYDASSLMAVASKHVPTLVDQGLDDQFLEEQLKPTTLVKSAVKNNYPLELRTHEGYDHSYHFIASFIEDHLSHHARYLIEAT